MSSAPIDRFKGKYAFLSNFAPAVVTLPDDSPPINYMSVEHAYQAAKSSERHVRAWVGRSLNAGEAKKRGRRIGAQDGWDREAWESKKEEVMLALLYQKFAHEPFRSQLLETGERMLIEGNTWNDRYWGVCFGEGKNRLGILLMEVRAEIAAGRV